MANPASGRYYINGKDMFDVFGVAIASGSNDFLKFPKRKPSIEHDWGDSHGIDKDLSRVFYEKKEIRLECWMQGANETDFWLKYDSFLAELSKPDTARITVSELSRSFQVYYSECTNAERETRIKAVQPPGVLMRFTLVVVQLMPNLGDLEQFIVAENNLFIVT